MHLREWREQNRPKPHLDDKIMVSWNGLMVRGGSLISIGQMRALMPARFRLMPWLRRPPLCLQSVTLSLVDVANLPNALSSLFAAICTMRLLGRWFAVGGKAKVL